MLLVFVINYLKGLGRRACRLLDRLAHGLLRSSPAREVCRCSVLGRVDRRLGVPDGARVGGIFGVFRAAPVALCLVVF